MSLYERILVGNNYLSQKILNCVLWEYIRNIFQCYLVVGNISKQAKWNKCEVQFLKNHWDILSMFWKGMGQGTSWGPLAEDCGSFLWDMSTSMIQLPHSWLSNFSILSFSLKKRVSNWSSCACSLMNHYVQWSGLKEQPQPLG